MAQMEQQPLKPLAAPPRLYASEAHPILQLGLGLSVFVMVPNGIGQGVRLLLLLALLYSLRGNQWVVDLKEKNFY